MVLWNIDDIFFKDFDLNIVIQPMRPEKSDNLFLDDDSASLSSF